MGSKTTTQSTKSRPVVTDQLKGLYNELTSLATGINRTPTADNPFARAAGLSPDELAAYQLVRDNTGRYQGALDQGLEAQLRAMEMSGRAPTQDELSAYMNPFTEQVLNRTLDRIREQGERNALDISSKSALSGAFGGSRQGLLEGLNMADTQRTIGDTYYRGMADNYNQGLATLLGQIDRLSGNARRTMEAAGAGQAYGLTDAAAREGIGVSQRQREQGDLDLRSQDWLRKNQEPYNKLIALANASGALSPGSIGQDSKTTTKQSGDPLSTILGVASLVAAPFTGGASLMGGIQGGLSGLVGSGLGGIFGGKKEGGPVKKFAYGGRVGNPFSQGESSDVIRQTQNPFKANGMATTPGGYNQAPIGSVLLGESPTVANTGGGFVPPDVTYNAGPVAVENINPADRGGNPVAMLLDQYKSGLRTGDPGNGFGSSDMMGRVNLASGGLVKKLAGGGFLESLFGGSVPTSGGKRKVDQLFGKDNLSDTLLNIGLSLLAAGGTPVGEGLAQGLGGSLESEAVDPLAEANLAYKQMQIQNIMDQIENRSRDDARAEEQFAARFGQSASQFSEAEARRREEFMTNLDLREKEMKEKAAKKPNFQASDYPGLTDATKTLEESLYGEEPDMVRAEGAAARLQGYADTLYNDGFDSQAMLIQNQLDDYEKRKPKKVNPYAVFGFK